MSKLMTLAVVFTYIQQGKLSLDDEFFISENAWRTGGAASGGSTMFAELNSQIRVEDLIRSVIIQSGNDAAIALAEGIGGTEQTFAQDRQPTRQADRPQRLELRQFDGSAGPRPILDRARSRAAGPLHHQHLSRVLRDLLRAGIHLEQDPPAQPQFAARNWHRRRWPQDRPHRGVGLRRSDLCAQ